MVRVSRQLMFVMSAALLALPGVMTFDMRAEPAPQAAAPSSGIDPMVLKGYEWRSIGPARGGRSIAVSGVKGRPKEAVLRSCWWRVVEDD